MLHRVVRALALGAALAAANAGAVTQPSDLMLPEPARAVAGYVESWLFIIDVESFDLASVEACRKMLDQHGFLITLSKTASSVSPDLHFKMTAKKAYAQASMEADDLLATVRKADCGKKSSKLSWTVSTQMAPAAPR